MTKVANCGHDERYKYSGGKAGDQTGDEWYIRDDYDFGQKVYLVHPNDKVNDLVARMAVSGAKNDHIGYDQGERTTFYTALKKANWIVANIKTDCESDCSAGVAAIVIGAGNRLGDKKLAAVSKDCYTGNLKAALTKAGYKAYTYNELIKKFGKKPKGCIQLNESKHVNIVVDGASNLPKDTTSSTNTSTSSAKTGKYKITTASGVNLRTGAGTDKPKTGEALTKGTTVSVTQTYSEGNSLWGKTSKGWFAIKYNGNVYAEKVS